MAHSIQVSIMVPSILYTVCGGVVIITHCFQVTRRWSSLLGFSSGQSEQAAEKTPMSAGPSSGRTGFKHFLVGKSRVIVSWEVTGNVLCVRGEGALHACSTADWGLELETTRVAAVGLLCVCQVQ
ncbi:hypothetical protein XELAEV_18024475mg [Xenopus laevis]|uniref:Uncharacterized protein n=1 Tax=Xenopus laevis TaxID=8355 RepID=A0A974CZ06_XENLA|nr:hypothetical protein XELAEV_18024475mg [Xenopus laevis]